MASPYDRRKKNNRHQDEQRNVQAAERMRVAHKLAEKIGPEGLLKTKDAEVVGGTGKNAEGQSFRRVLSGSKEYHVYGDGRKVAFDRKDPAAAAQKAVAERSAETQVSEAARALARHQARTEGNRTMAPDAKLVNAAKPPSNKPFNPFARRGRGRGRGRSNTGGMLAPR